MCAVATATMPGCAPRWQARTPGDPDMRCGFMGESGPRQKTSPACRTPRSQRGGVRPAGYSGCWFPSRAFFLNPCEPVGPLGANDDYPRLECVRGRR